MSANTRTHSFKPTVEGLEEPALMSGAPLSPLSVPALNVLQQSYYSLVALQNATNYYADNPCYAGQMPGYVGNLLVMQRNLQNTMRLFEQVENVYEAWGYHGSQFRAFDYYFHAIDQAVMNQAVADMQWFYAVYGTHF
jgi:hypothetical protein